MSRNEIKTFVLVGRIGNGKSSTGNSIIGDRVFKAQAGLTSVTCTSLLKSVTLDDGQIINVIDTPGLFDTELRHDFICKEIVKCLDFAKGGIHALLLVMSATNRFSNEEFEAINVMMDIFGAKITDYLTVIFTGLDNLKLDGITPEDNLNTFPGPLQKILGMCRQRHVYFDNRTKDEDETKQQVQNLLTEVNKSLDMNDGKPFTNAMMNNMQKKQKLPEEDYAQMLCESTQQIEATMRQSIEKLEQRLDEERIARINAEVARQITSVTVTELRSQLEKAKMREREANSICSIM